MNPFPTPPAPPRLRRFACMMYEAVLLFGVVFVADYLLDTLTQSRNALMLRDVRQFWIFLAIGGYFLLCWRRSGQTLPMKTWHIRLVSRDGLPPSVTRLLLRYALAWLLPLAGMLGIWGLASATHWPAVMMLVVAAPFANFVGTWLDPEGQFLHDRWAGTRLVSVPPSAKPSRNAAART
jgi:uncharacterized RDD family membrane protein YckC